MTKTYRSLRLQSEQKAPFGDLPCYGQTVQLRVKSEKELSKKISFSACFD